MILSPSCFGITMWVISLPCLPSHKHYCPIWHYSLIALLIKCHFMSCVMAPRKNCPLISDRRPGETINMRGFLYSTESSLHKKKAMFLLMHLGLH